MKTKIKIMRTIKFRGIQIDSKEWIYGWLSSSKTIAIISGDDYDDIEVIPESVGQFTGLKDKNGKDVYEGDVMEHRTEGVFTVAWDSFWLSWTAKTEGSEAVDQMDSRYLESCKIIGSIHEIPELLNN